MLKKTVLAMFALVFVLALAAPPKASAQVTVGFGAGPRPAYGYVVVHPRPRYYAPPPYWVSGPPLEYPPYLYGERVWVGGRWGYRPYGYRYGWRGREWREHGRRDWR